MPDFLIPPRDLLSFYAEAGVDAAVGETPNDYLSAPPIAPPASPLRDMPAQIHPPPQPSPAKAE